MSVLCCAHLLCSIVYICLPLCLGLVYFWLWVEIKWTLCHLNQLCSINKCLSKGGGRSGQSARRYHEGHQRRVRSNRRVRHRARQSAEDLRRLRAAGRPHQGHSRARGRPAETSRRRGRGEDADKSDRYQAERLRQIRQRQTGDWGLKCNFKIVTAENPWPL